MNKQQASSGIGLSGLLFLVFVAAKLWDRIDWSWWWVCSPLWAPASAVLAIGVVVLLAAAIMWCAATVSELGVNAAKKLRGRRDNDL